MTKRLKIYFLPSGGPCKAADEMTISLSGIRGNNS